jgi:predicted NAD/FAD-dependent oxidoreductase
MAALMKHPMSTARDRMSTAQEPLRVEIVGGGIAGLSCARQLILRGHDPVVFEGSAHLGGRCSSLSTRVGLFDNGAQCISGATRRCPRAAIGCSNPPIRRDRSRSVARQLSWTRRSFGDAPHHLCARQWRYGFVETTATTPRRTVCLWDDKLRLGVRGDSVVASRVDRVHRIGVARARAVAEGLGLRGGRSPFIALIRDPRQLLEAQL